MILILSKESDKSSIELVSKKLAEKNEKFFFFDVSRIMPDGLQAEIDGSSPRLVLGDETISLDEVKSVWIRRPFEIISNTDNPKPVLDSHVEKEIRNFVEGIIGIVEFSGVYVLNNPFRHNLIGNKIYQWWVFSELNVRFPETKLLTDIGGLEPEKYITKPLIDKSFSVNGKDYVLPTTVLTKTAIESLKKHSLPPMLVQKKVDIKYEIRVTAINGKLFAAKIKYNSEKVSDYRLLLGEPGMISYSVYDLPIETEEMCQKVLQFLDLDFGCIDLAVDGDGRHWFLEVNPNGQWGWIEVETKMPISTAIAELLASPPSS